jgi:hypothetical protein
MDKQEQTSKGCMHSASLWVLSVASVAVLGIVAYAVYLVRAYLHIIGYIILICVALLPALGVIALATWLIKFILKAEVIELGPSGNVIRFFGKITELHPLGMKEFKAPGHVQVKADNTIEIPDLLHLLKHDMLGGLDLLLGYRVDGTPRYGMWDDLRTFVVAGKSRSGKTVTMAFYIVQALLAGAVVYVCDPHYSKKSGLLKVLDPLVPYLQVARKDSEIVTLVKNFKAIMETRVAALDSSNRPMLLVIDEWSKLLRDLSSDDTDVLVNTVLACAEEYAGYNGYAMIAGHEWTARESGGRKGAAIRRGFHAVFLHRIDEEYARYLLPGAKGRKMAKQAPNLATGRAIFLDAEGDYDTLRIPYYGDRREAIYEVAAMLQELPSGTPQHRLLDGPGLDSPGNAGNTGNAAWKLETEQETCGKQRIEQVDDIQGMLTEQETSLDRDLTVLSHSGNDAATVALIQRMHSRNIPLRDIAYIVGLSGRKYAQFKVLCEKAGIATTQTGMEL